MFPAILFLALGSEVYGEVTKVDGSTVVIENREGIEYEVGITKDTKILLDGKPANKDAIRPGMKCRCEYEGKVAKKLALFRQGGAGAPPVGTWLL